MSWIESLQKIEEFEDAEFDTALVAEMEQAGSAGRQRLVRFSTPTFKEYESSELQSCGKNSFPAFSITAGGCALMCDHCEARILEPMIPAVKPEHLDRQVRRLIETEELQADESALTGESHRGREGPIGLERRARAGTGATVVRTAPGPRAWSPCPWRCGGSPPPLPASWGSCSW